VVVPEVERSSHNAASVEGDAPSGGPRAAVSVEAAKGAADLGGPAGPKGSPSASNVQSTFSSEVTAVSRLILSAPPSASGAITVDLRLRQVDRSSRGVELREDCIGGYLHSRAVRTEGNCLRM
jgi:hypothetical protein